MGEIAFVLTGSGSLRPGDTASGKPVVGKLRLLGDLGVAEAVFVVGHGDGFDLPEVGVECDASVRPATPDVVV